MKSEVETVIKTGRQIVQKQQTENPKELDERLTALKLQYNELGARVRPLIYHAKLDSLTYIAKNPLLSSNNYCVFACLKSLKLILPVFFKSIILVRKSMPIK